jgi:phosphoribosyl 1,2-cyclic phosphodiesterase
MIMNHGVRGSIPNSSRKTVGFGGNTICVEIKTSKYQLIFDCGSGFSKVDFDNDLQTILFISHFHHDHIQGLAFNDYSSVADKKIIITSAHSDKETTYNNLFNYYTKPYFPIKFLDIINKFEFHEFNNVVRDFTDLKINSIQLNHPGLCSGYSIISNQKKFCYLLDNEFQSNQKDKLINFCDNSDTVIWDGMYLESEMVNKKGWGHSSIEQGIEIASQIEVKNFLISHHAPQREDSEIDSFQKQLASNNIKFASENEVIEF